jgi:hypothetical protein
MEYEGMPPDYERGVQVTKAGFMGIFFVELVLKMIAVGRKTYFTEGWTILDFIIVVGSLADVFLTFIAGSTVFSLSVIRVFRVFAILKLIKWSKRLRMMMRTLLISIPPVVNVMALWGIITFVYAVIGVAVFGDAIEGENLYQHATFKDFGSAVYILLRIVTGESWEDVMFDLYNPPNNLLGAPAYFYTYLVLCGMLMLEVVVGIILDLFSNNYFVAEDDVSADSADNFVSAWSKRDPLGSMFIPIHVLPSLLGDIEPPLGPGPLERDHMIRYITRLPLPIRKNSMDEDSIYYGDLLRTLLQLAAPVGLNDPKTIRKLERKWYSRFPHLKALPGGVKYTVKHYVAAIKLQRAFRARLRGTDVNSGFGTSRFDDRDVKLYDDVFQVKGVEWSARETQQANDLSLSRKSPLSSLASSGNSSFRRTGASSRSRGNTERGSGSSSGSGSGSGSVRQSMRHSDPQDLRKNNNNEEEDLRKTAPAAVPKQSVAKEKKKSAEKSSGGSGDDKGKQEEN